MECRNITALEGDQNVFEKLCRECGPCDTSCWTGDGNGVCSNTVNQMPESSALSVVGTLKVFRTVLSVSCPGATGLTEEISGVWTIVSKRSFCAWITSV